MINRIKTLFLDNDRGMILLTLMLFSMMLLGLSLTMLYQAESNYQLSTQTRDNIEAFMAAETGYEACVSRIIYRLNDLGYQDNFFSARPGQTLGWPDYVIRLYDNDNNPTKFRLVAQPTHDFWDGDASGLNRDLSSAVDVSDDYTNPNYFLVTRQEALSAGDTFKIDDIHYYRAWLEADRNNETSANDQTAYLMVQGFRGKPDSALDPSDPNYIPQSSVLMQYRIRLSKDTLGWESGNVSQYGASEQGTGASYSGGEIDMSGSTTVRDIVTGN